jgi:hypothetical protein
MDKCSRHKWDDGWVSEKCELMRAEYMAKRKERGLSDTPFPRLRRVNKDIELITELILRNDAKDAPQKTEYNGKWYQSIIPVGKDHVAYLTFDVDAFQAMRKIWEEAQT